MYLVFAVIMIVTSRHIMLTRIRGQAGSDTASVCDFVSLSIFWGKNKLYLSLGEYSIMPELFGNQADGDIEVSEQITEQAL